MPIMLAPLGQKVKIVAISADDDVKKRLTDLGLAVGGYVTPLSSSGGNLVVDVLGARVAINRDVAMKIRVAAA